MNTYTSTPNVAIPPRIDPHLNPHIQTTAGAGTMSEMSRYQKRRRSSPWTLKPLPENHEQSNDFDSIRPYIYDIGQEYKRTSPCRRGSLQTLPDKDSFNPPRKGSEDLIHPDYRFMHYGKRKQSLQTGLFFKSISVSDTNSIASGAPANHLKVKIVMIGDSGVGKTTFLRTLISGKFTQSSKSNLTMATVTKVVEYKGKEVTVDFHDTAGQEKYRSLTTSFYRHAHGGLLFFNVHNKQSFKNIEAWLEDMRNYVGKDKTSVVLVGLVHKPGERDANSARHGVANGHPAFGANDEEHKRVIPRAQAEHMASEWGVPYTEVDIHRDHNSVIAATLKLLDLVLENTIFQSKELSVIRKLESSTAERGCQNCCGICN